MGKRRKIRAKTPWLDSAVLNNVTYQHFYDYLLMIAVSRFEWENLPSTCDSRFFELNINTRGYCLFFEDELMGYLTLPCVIGGGFDVYNIPIERRAFASNGYNATRDRFNSVIVYNNYLHTGIIPSIEMYAYKLYNCSRSIDVNILQQKFPFLVKMSEQQRLSYNNALMKYDGNQHMIMVDESFNTDNITVFPTQVPFVASNIEIELHQIMNEFFTFMGIENSNQDKRERMITDEVSGNAGGIELSRNIHLVAREQAVKEINEMFDLNIRVKFRSELMTDVNMPQSIWAIKQAKVKEGDVSNGSLYDTSKDDNRADDS